MKPSTDPARQPGGASVRECLAHLAAARRRYGPGSTAAKLALLESLCARRLTTARAVGRLHEHLQFLRAFPDDPRVLAAVTAQLESFGRRVRTLPAASRRRLEDSGIAGTVSRHCFDAPIVEWLVARCPGQVDIDWSGFADTKGLEFLLRCALLRAEEDGFDSADVSIRAWLQRAKGASTSNDLAWLVATLGRQRHLVPLWPALWEQAAVPIVWRLSDTRAGGATLDTRPAERIRYRAAGLRPAPLRPRRLITTPLRRIELLGRARARQVIDLTRTALTARCREVYAVTHANPAEVYLADLGAGASVAVIGVRPEMRLSLEANYGFLLLANGVPIGYGGVTPLFRQANTGINVFDAYRGSEAAMLWTQTLRAFHTLFGVTRFIVNPYQFGAGNSEAIASGAFWFYYRLGFRPAARATRRLAARELARRTARPGHRTDSATLRALARGDLELSLNGARSGDRFAEPWLERLSLLVSERFAALGPAGRGEAALLRQVRRMLGATGRSRVPRAVEHGLHCLAPLLALIDDLPDWPARERAALRALLSAKGAPQEAGFVRAAQRRPRLFAALAALARQARATGPVRRR
jgi:hypothetical protein